MMLQVQGRIESSVSFRDREIVLSILCLSSGGSILTTRVESRRSEIIGAGRCHLAIAVRIVSGIAVRLYERW